MTETYEKCDRCERDVQKNQIKTVEFDEEYEICSGCFENIEERINTYYWYDRWTDDHHEKVIELLEDRDEIECFHAWKDGGEYAVHTPYVSSEIISDLCDQFGLRITSFGPVWEQEGMWDCVEDHGSMFQITLSYDTRSPPPIPAGAEFHWIDIDFLDDADKQFD